MAEHIAGRARNADKLDVMEEHLHSESCVYPSLAAGVAVLSGAIWTLGNFVELIPINTIVKDFDIHWLVLEAVTDDETYEMVFYNVETEISRVRWSSDLAAGGRVISVPIPTLMPIQLKNSQIQCKLASSGAAETATISVIYHTY
jgi:hypothetical protein